MTDSALLAAIKASAAAKAQADTGNDSGVAATITAGITGPTPITFAALMTAAPTTLILEFNGRGAGWPSFAVFEISHVFTPAITLEFTSH